MEVCPSNALEMRRHGNGAGYGVRLKADKCIGCRKCETVCIMRAINFDSETKKPIICRHCGMCAQFCPHNCLQMIEAEEAVRNA
jgi:formate hydrogenlyase subunit 6/NADH:ubiquinone oxidoreductase subunit I